MARANLSGKKTKTVACEISDHMHMKVSTLARLTGRPMRELVAHLITSHDLDRLVREALDRAIPVGVR